MNLAKFIVQLQQRGLGGASHQLAVLIALYTLARPATSTDLQHATGIPHARDIVRTLHRYVRDGLIIATDVPNARQTFSPRRTYQLSPEGRRHLQAARRAAKPHNP